MSDNVQFEAKSEPDNTNAAVENPPVIQEGSSTASLNPNGIILFCAVGLIICFFVPWMDLLLVKVSGIMLTKEGGWYLLLWGLPIASAITIMAAYTKKNLQSCAIFTSAIPFCLLGFALKNIGKDTFNMLDSGAYISLVLGVIMFSFAIKLK